MKRELTEEERKLTLQGIRKIEGEIEWLEYLREHRQLMIRKGLPLNFEKQMKEAKNELNSILNDLQIKNKSLEEMNRHLREGVEIKEE